MEIQLGSFARDTARISLQASLKLLPFQVWRSRFTFLPFYGEVALFQTVVNRWSGSKMLSGDKGKDTSENNDFLNLNPVGEEVLVRQLRGQGKRDMGDLSNGFDFSNLRLDSLFGLGLELRRQNGH